jgi:hypothetical protein
VHDTSVPPDAAAHPFAFDWKEDGAIDLYLSNNIGEVILMENKKYPYYVQQTVLATNPTADFGDMGGYLSPVSFDVDKDGDVDLFIGLENGDILYMENTGNLKFTPHPGSYQSCPTALCRTNPKNPFYINNQFHSPPDSHNYKKLCAFDANNDGKMDMYVGQKDGKVRFFKNTGTNTNLKFTEQLGTNNPFNGVDVGTHASPAIMDFDGTGVYHAFVGNGDGEIYGYQNTGTRSSPVYSAGGGAGDCGAACGRRLEGAGHPMSGVDVGTFATLFVFDYNGDGDSDLFVGNGDGKIRLFPRANGQGEETGASNPFHGIDVGSNAALTAFNPFGDDVDSILIGNKEGFLQYFSFRCKPKKFCSGRGSCAKIGISGSECQCKVGESAGDQW